MRRAILALPLLLGACGCGTLCNLPDSPPTALHWQTTRRPYGGVRLDAAFGAKCLASAAGHEVSWAPDMRAHLEYGRATRLALGLYTLGVDLPLCLAADTLTLPYVLVEGPGLDMALP